MDSYKKIKTTAIGLRLKNKNKALLEILSKNPIDICYKLISYNDNKFISISLLTIILQQEVRSQIKQSKVEFLALVTLLSSLFLKVNSQKFNLKKSKQCD